MHNLDRPISIRICPDGAVVVCDESHQVAIGPEELRSLAALIEAMRSNRTEFDSQVGLKNPFGAKVGDTGILANALYANKMPPVFILGSHRSGTTLARYLLDAHTDIACPPESKFIAGLHSMVNYPQVATAMRHFGLTRVGLYRHVRMLIESIMWQYTYTQGKKRWVEKTPNYFRIAEFIDDTFHSAALYIIMFRHPLDCVDSLDRFSQRLPIYDRPDPELTTYSAMYGAGKYGWSKYWHDANEHLIAFQSGRSKQCIGVKYEELISAPQEVLRRTLAFIGSDYEEGLVERAFKAKHTMGFQDPSIASSNAVDTKRTGRWRSWPSEEREVLWDIVQPVASRLGYDIL